MDLADAGDLDHAVARRATLRGRLGHEGSMDVRRSEAVGEMARHELMLDLEVVVDEETGEITMAIPCRKAELHLHVTDATHRRQQVHHYETDWPQAQIVFACPGTGPPPDE